MLVVHNNSETAVCGCHCLRDIAVPMREVLAWVGVCVPLALPLHYIQGNFRLSAIESGSISIFHQLLYFMTFLNKFNSARLGEIFPRWQLVIAITSVSLKIMSVLSSGL